MYRMLYMCKVLDFSPYIFSSFFIKMKKKCKKKGLYVTPKIGVPDCTFYTLFYNVQQCFTPKFGVSDCTLHISLLTPPSYIFTPVHFFFIFYKNEEKM